MKDIYRGYEIDYGSDHEDYLVWKDKEIVHRAKSYDAAADWIDAKRMKEIRS